MTANEIALKTWKLWNEYYNLEGDLESKQILDIITKDIEELTTPKQKLLADFCKHIAKQEDCPAEFIEIVNKEFWNLID